MSEGPVPGPDFSDDDSSEPPPEEGAPLWTVTFGDMMSLLLTFFILLFSMSELRMEQFLLASQGLREAMGGTAVETAENPIGPAAVELDPDLELQSAAAPSGPPSSGEALLTDSAAAVLARAELLADQYLDSIARELRAFVEEYGLEDALEVEQGEEGVHLRIQAVVLFASGEATISPDVRWLIDVLARITQQIKTPLVVAGHADDQPIATPSFASNWELSAARAAGVARGLVEEGHDPQRVRVESYGEYRPIADNAEEAGRRRNRRVELVYTRQDVVDQALAEVRAEEAARAPS